ncbi:polygalacturonase [Coniella lustricola]|uniref:galacturonan 1,4-alpha-galacturonidase n=1 Tax=Coniella lustricola TaxID=2025994 RepID=A0A2T2ZW60_9PEZI|nr:polygalacturonase [Coniella lustricola]
MCMCVKSIISVACLASKFDIMHGNSLVHSLAAGILVATPLATAFYTDHKRSSTARPAIQPFPYNTGYASFTSLARDANKTCVVAAPANASVDAASTILAAFETCNNGGTVILDAEYTIASRLDLTFLQSVDVAITGTINFADDIDYWTSPEGAFSITYQNSSTFWKIGGTDVNIYGNSVGVINGNGETWWEAAQSNDTLVRPILFVADGLEGATISGLNYVNPPNWFNLIANSTDVTVSNLNLSAVWSTGAEAPNTDGWDIYKSDSVVVQDSNVNNGDDCVSFKPNSTNIVVQNLICNGSHGVSVGSLGQYVDEYDIVENVTVYNISMSNASDGARIKVWPGIESSEGALLDGGGGSGYVKNVTYDLLVNYDNTWAIEVNQCYGQSNTTLCELYPSKMTISEIWFNNFTGTTSSSKEPYVGTLVCSSTSQCWDIYASDITVKPPNGAAPEWTCSGFNTSGLEGFDCVASA